MKSLKLNVFQEKYDQTSGTTQRICPNVFIFQNKAREKDRNRLKIFTNFQALI